MARFPDTQWSLIRRSVDTPSVSRVAFAQLVQDYRPAVLAYFRARMAQADAEDATQSFLTSSFEHGWWARADAALGSFRGFLLMLLQRHAVRVREASPTGESLELASESVDPGPAPEQRFDARFALQLTTRALDRLRESYRDRKREALFSVLVGLLANPPEHGQLQHVAADLGLAANTLTIELRRLRARLNHGLSEELRQLCADEATFEREWTVMRQLLGAG